MVKYHLDGMKRFFMFPLETNQAFVNRHAVQLRAQSDSHCEYNSTVLREKGLQRPKIIKYYERKFVR